ncbi:hypothetical protein B4065_0167 [Caldibacillus thermoamylovorans]|uniref:phage tail tape measure protein n=1 Tax=Caldibacillus thermoamylovorans TaxID=35841 RepID=UPI0005A46162|nr:phage tail tape measure protein [Caldibacillus thermoamylovorans]KIO60241.1 hypothetical protein B4065_0167 [Caldibacillus thermoamylovorans]
MTTELGALRARLLLEAENFKRGMQNARNEMQKTGQSAKKVSTDFDAMQGAVLAVAGGIAGGIGLAAKKAIDFENQMSRVKAISGANTQEFKALEQAALDLGAQTSKSASEVAVAFEDMAARGFDANQIIAAMPGIISAAEASGSDLALTTDVVTAALNSFKLEASEANRIADIMAVTANESAASVEDLGYAFKYAAPIAKQLGISIEELAAATGIMVDAGLEGSQAGTTLRQALLRLVDPTDEAQEALNKLGVKTTDSQKKFVGLSKILPQFQKGLEGMTDAQKAAALSTIFGTEAVSGMTVLIEAGTEKYEDFTTALKNSAGESKKAADIMKDNVAGAWEEFTGALESAGIKLGKEFLPLFKDVINWGTQVVEKLSDVDYNTVKTGLSFAGTATAIALTATTVGKLLHWVNKLKGIMGPAGWLIVGLSVLGGLFSAIKTSIEENEKVNLDYTNSLIDQQLALEESVSKYEALRDKLQWTNKEFAEYLDIQQRLKTETDPTKIKELKDRMAELQEASGFTVQELDNFIALDKDIREKAPETQTVLTNYGQAFIDLSSDLDPILDKQREFLYNQLEIEKNDAHDKLKKTADEYLKTQESLNQLIQRHNDKLVEQADLRQKAKDLQDEINKAEADGDKARGDHLRREQEGYTAKANALQSEIDQLYKGFSVDQKRLANLYERIAQESKVYDQLVEQELKMAGINGKASEAVQLIDEKIAKLNEEKAGLDRNSSEYQSQVEKINEQISKLQDTKGRIQDIKGEQSKVTSEILTQIQKGGELNTILNADTAKKLTITPDPSIDSINRSLMKSVNKKLNIEPSPTIDRLEERISRAIPKPVYPTYIPSKPSKHTGGPVVNKLIPELHVGGVPSWLIDPPLHNEVDIRALPNEMILTEAQQANLFRMIDAGFMPNQSSNSNITDNGPINNNQIPSVLEVQVLANIDGKELSKEIAEPVRIELNKLDVRNQIIKTGRRKS